MVGVVRVAYKQDSEAGAAGPEDPMIEARVAALELDVSKIKGILERLEPKIGEILLTGAKQADLQRVETATAKIDGTMSQLPKGADFTAVKAEIAELRGRILMLPTWWMLLVALIATWGAGAAIIKFGIK